MSVYARGGVFWTEFEYKGVRHRLSTGQITRDAALAVERQLKDQARQRAHGVAIAPARETPKFHDWAQEYFDYCERKGYGEERVTGLIKGVLRFFGRRPADPAKVYPGAPYHDLALGDVIDDPTWLATWETWLRQPKRAAGNNTKGRTLTWSGQTRDHHRSTLSQMYALALRPEWRKITGVTENPCVGVEREGRQRRTMVLEAADILAILTAASYHLRLAMAIALLAPKLRVANILKLEFATHFSDDFQWLTVRDHKTAGKTGKPLVAYVPEQLRAILRDAKARAGRHTHVITYQGQPLATISDAFRGAVTRAAATRPALAYGRDRADGITFHTLRHTASTRGAQLGVSIAQLLGLMGHERIETTLDYTHLRPRDEIEPAERLSSELPIQDLVTVKRLRPPAAPGKTVGTSRAQVTKTGAKRGQRRTTEKRRVS